ncbi:lipopolysaccharide biosynthesis protein [Chiayiivirga flava]|uniref:O-antigen/teichoic acid export membrane protein n=1 Tax=Chiayiivirga flava TaxID=659595 RepID=A0A7W8D7Y5_9GAMM|nr:hypothetical protein [Chiayiivirga flava]MBB5208440.1 O-antigen/teichoic acid export membrane protein [Chiayiivirga flava]
MRAEPGHGAPPPARAWRLLPLLDNLASGYAYLGFAALVTLVLVPIYVHALGPVAWGTVAWCLTLQGVLFALDAALAPLLLRDAARAAAAGRLHLAERRFLRVYGAAALAIFVAGQWALSWLDPLPGGATTALRLALVQFLFQFANNAAIGVWHALRRQRFANLRLAGFALLKHALALLLVLHWQATAVAYFLPFAAVSAVEFALNRRRRRREPAPASEPHAVDADHDGWRGVAGVATVTALAIAGAQIDRIVLARQLAADDYGLYFLLGSVLLAVLHLQMPLQRTFLPRIAIAADPHRAAWTMLLATTLLLALPCIAAVPWAEALLRIWLRDAGLAAAGAPTLQLMLSAAALFALSGPAGALLLAQRRYRALAAIQGCTFIAQLLVLLTLAPRWGAAAGGLAWLVGGAVQLAAGGVILRRAAVRSDSSTVR